MNKITNKKEEKKKKRKSLKINWKKIVFFIIIIILIYKINTISRKNEDKDSGIINKKISNYETIKEDENKKYEGKGQERVENKEGYFTTFTTKNNKCYIEYKQNGVSPWAKNKYWGGTMEENGCGITALSIILSGYNKNYTPEDLRKKYYPVLNYEKFEKELNNTFKIKSSEFYYDSMHFSKEKLNEHLKTDKPILICVWNKPNSNRWTQSSHYMVLLATDGENEVYISNPNGLENDSKSSGWYNYSEIIPYIAKVLYIEE